jgi:hypothetical protein
MVTAGGAPERQLSLEIRWLRIARVRIITCGAAEFRAAAGPA